MNETCYWNLGQVASSDIKLENRSSQHNFSIELDNNSLVKEQMGEDLLK